MNAQHTPTPWQINPADGREVIAPTEAMVVCRTPEALYQKRAPGNAAFIVRACNGWNDVNALRARLAELEAAQ